MRHWSIFHLRVGPHWTLPSSGPNPEVWPLLDRRATASSDPSLDGSKTSVPIRIRETVKDDKEREEVNQRSSGNERNAGQTFRSRRMYFDWLAVRLFSKMRVVTLADWIWAWSSRTCFWSAWFASSRRWDFSIQSSADWWSCSGVLDTKPDSVAKPQATISSWRTWYSTSYAANWRETSSSSAWWSKC